MSIRSYLLSFLFAAFLPLTAAWGQQALSEQDIRMAVVGKSMLWSDGGTATYDADGGYGYRRTNGEMFRGKWTVAGDHMCVDFGNGRKPCFQFFRDAQGLSVTNDKGNKFMLTPITAEAAATPQTPGTLKECEQTIAYSIQTPAADVAENIRTFSGAWTGKWEGGLCGAVVVEGVFADGTARLLYVFGTLPQYGIKAGNFRLSGKIVGNKLTAAGGSMTVEYTIRGPAQLAGRFTNQYGPSNGTFARQ